MRERLLCYKLNIAQDRCVLTKVIVEHLAQGLCRMEVIITTGSAAKVKIRSKAYRRFIGTRLLLTSLCLAGLHRFYGLLPLGSLCEGRIPCSIAVATAEARES